MKLTQADRSGTVQGKGDDSSQCSNIRVNEDCLSRLRDRGQQLSKDKGTEGNSWSHYISCRQLPAMGMKDQAKAYNYLHRQGTRIPKGLDRQCHVCFQNPWTGIEKVADSTRNDTDWCPFSLVFPSITFLFLITFNPVPHKENTLSYTVETSL